jgi:hypothetical protein
MHEKYVLDRNGEYLNLLDVVINFRARLGL